MVEHVAGNCGLPRRVGQRNQTAQVGDEGEVVRGGQIGGWGHHVRGDRKAELRLRDGHRGRKQFTQVFLGGLGRTTRFLVRPMPHPAGKEPFPNSRQHKTFGPHDVGEIDPPVPHQFKFPQRLGQRHGPTLTVAGAGSGVVVGGGSRLTACRPQAPLDPPP